MASLLRVVAHYNETAEQVATSSIHAYPTRLGELEWLCFSSNGKPNTYLTYRRKPKTSCRSISYRRKIGELGMRTLLAVPLLKGKERQLERSLIWCAVSAEPFTEREMELVKTFADQAVIADRRTCCLFKELQHVKPGPHRSVGAADGDQRGAQRHCALAR